MNRQSIQKLLAAAVPAGLFAVMTVAIAQHPGVQPRVTDEDGPADAEFEITDDGMTTIWKTKKTHFPQSKPFQDKEPSNLLPTIYEPLRDSGGDVIPNTLPSTPSNPYNLHPDPEVVDDIDARSPRSDLKQVINDLKAAVFPKDRRATNRELFRNGRGVPADPRRGGREVKENENPGTIEERASFRIDYEQVQFAIDILEGNPIDREYSGMPLLHYKGPEMVEKVDPETNTATVEQAWMRSRIKSDTMFIDPSTIPPNETWTIRYEVSVLHWGHEDFAPFMVMFDDPQDVGGPGVMHAAMDQSFFPMEEGKKYIFEVQMPPHRYWNLTYHWGWRVHPPRIQAVEKALKKPLGKNIVKWESDVFGENPTSSREAKLEAISMLSDLAPAKRMWHALRAIKGFEDRGFLGRFFGARRLRDLVRELELAFEDWKNRSILPRGIEEAEGYDQTVVYLNNHLYGGMHAVEGESEMSWSDWQTRGATLKTKIYNGDYFPHAYMNVDFGGRRGWENIYQNTIPLGHQGPWFTFGRAHLSRNLQKGGLPPKPAIIPAAERPSDGEHLGEGMMNLRKALRPDHAGKPGKPDHAGKKGPPEHARSVPVLPPATEEAMNSKWMQHPGPEVAAYRNKKGLGEHNVEIEFRYEPNTRLRFYQFDPTHHNENIMSVH